MPATVTLEQSQMTTPALNLLGPPLERDVVITLKWRVQDDQNRPIMRQTAQLLFNGAPKISANLGSGDSKVTFHLSQGSQIAFPVTARITVDLGDAGPHAPAVQVPSNLLDLQCGSVLFPERESLTAVYGELNQELRRMRTLYETFLVVATGGFAALVSQADKIAGSPPYRHLMAWGLLGLTAILIDLVWEVAKRYNQTTAWIQNLEIALGVRAGNVPAEMLPEKVKWGRKGGTSHLIWAMALISYTLALGSLSTYLVYKAPPPRAIQSQSAASVPSR
jgi:hypothetical protein